MLVICTHEFPSLKYYLGENVYVCMCMYAYHWIEIYLGVHVCICECIYIVYCL